MVIPLQGCDSASNEKAVSFKVKNIIEKVFFVIEIISFLALVIMLINAFL